MTPDLLSIVIPVYNESESLKLLYSELADVASENAYVIEVIFVDDGSTDSSWQVIEQLAKEHRDVRGIRLRRNFGKAAALNAGFDAVNGPLVFTLDADLQDDPHEIPRFLEAMDNQLDVVSGWKRVRHDPWHKVGPSRVFNWLVGRMTGVRLHDHNCGFKCYRSGVFDEVHLYGEMHRFVPVLASAHGWRVGEIEVNHRAREFGHSKYGAARFIKGLLDLLTVYFLTGFGQRPLHLLGSIGLLFFVLGGGGIFVLTVLWIVSRSIASMPVVNLHERAVFYYSIVAVLLGTQFMTAGFLAELITAHFGRDRKPYSVSQRVNGSEFNKQDAD